MPGVAKGKGLDGRDGCKEGSGRTGSQRSGGLEDEKPAPRAIRKGTPQVVEFVASSRAASNLVGELEKALEIALEGNS